VISNQLITQVNTHTQLIETAHTFTDRSLSFVKHLSNFKQINMLICLNINSKSTSFSVSKSKLFVLVSVCAGVFGALIGCVSKLHCQAEKKGI